MSQLLRELLIKQSPNGIAGVFFADGGKQIYILVYLYMLSALKLQGLYVC